MKELIYTNDDQSLRALYVTNLEDEQDDESVITLMDIRGVGYNGIRHGALPNLEQTYRIDQLTQIAQDANLKLDKVSKSGITNVIAIGTSFAFTTSSPLPDGTNGNSYSETVAAQGGSAAGKYGENPGDYTFNLESGSLPPGVSLNSDTGEISGTPTSTGTYTFTIGCTDLYGQKITKQYTITINA